MKKIEELQTIIRLYKQETGKHEVEMLEVAKYAMRNGVKAPTPKTELELLAEKFSHAASIEHRRDPITGRSYRANHALKRTLPNGDQLTLWVDIQEATRGQMHASLSMRRQQMVGDAVQLKTDEGYWNSQNPNEAPIQMIMDFTDDVEERFNAPLLDAA
jgi:hypothetical protein